eukprot:TRINITY_DN7152_c1_g1_i1.p2 TRINITY_DN7152_c1_g1~~TRINITY_DN7152_c1_g1_i1.p2  ORF type:complete len:438 (-),score=131.13 TRINITY_DN7152_c1_g1_i1:1372-2583(-)
MQQELEQCKKDFLFLGNESTTDYHQCVSVLERCIDVCNNVKKTHFSLCCSARMLSLVANECSLFLNNRHLLDFFNQNEKAFEKEIPDCLNKGEKGKKLVELLFNKKPKENRKTILEKYKKIAGFVEKLVDFESFNFKAIKDSEESISAFYNLCDISKRFLENNKEDFPSCLCRFHPLFKESESFGNAITSYLKEFYSKLNRDAKQLDISMTKIANIILSFNKIKCIERTCVILGFNENFGAKCELNIKEYSARALSLASSARSISIDPNNWDNFDLEVLSKIKYLDEVHRVFTSSIPDKTAIHLWVEENLKHEWKSGKKMIVFAPSTDLGGGYKSIFGNSVPGDSLDLPHGKDTLLATEGKVIRVIPKGSAAVFKVEKDTGISSSMSSQSSKGSSATATSEKK